MSLDNSLNKSEFESPRKELNLPERSAFFIASNLSTLSTISYIEI